MSSTNNIKILFLAANPVDTVRLQLSKEYKEIDSAILRSEYRDHFDLRHEPSVSLEELDDLLLRFRPHFVHFSGHGSEKGALIFENRDGRAEVASPNALTNLFRILKEEIVCILLNACYSERQAKAIVKHIPCVIGMSTAISDEAAIKFAASFYLALGYGKSVNDAFELGCNELERLNIPEEQTPKLEYAPGIDPAKVFVSGNIAQEKIQSSPEQPEFREEKPISQPSPGGFQPLGRWHIRTQDSYGTPISEGYVEFSPTGFRGNMQTMVYGISTPIEIEGSWMFDPKTQILLLQGVNRAPTGISPIGEQIRIVGQQGNSYDGTGNTGVRYFLTKS